MFLVAFFMFTTLLRVFLLASTSVSAKAVFPRAANATRAVVQKRFGDARFTFFDTGLGACGSTNVASDFIVALNSEQYGNGEHCYEMVEITYKGKTKQAQIVDECPGCPYAALDMSTGLFDFFASEDLGVIYGSWVFCRKHQWDDQEDVAYEDIDHEQEDSDRGWPVNGKVLHFGGEHIKSIGNTSSFQRYSGCFWCTFGGCGGGSIAVDSV
ncbi:RlpA-like double-psi beta-barrel-protein domain-containing protein-containing protein [Mycena amicta]|nr:RlpA-like double-psi beta-barrel-protein domain-containing protein-containing protein [Mycena amicta]